MSEISPAYQLAQHIFETVYLENDMLSEADLTDARIRRQLGASGVQRVVAVARHITPEYPRYETLTKCTNGNFLFQAAVGPEFAGNVSLGRHVITPKSDEAMAIRLAESLMVHELAHVANTTAR